MAERNTLRTSPTVVAIDAYRNTKGRPNKTQSVVFSTQPRSIVSQILEKMLTENKIMVPIESTCVDSIQNSTSIDEESDQNSTDLIFIGKTNKSDEYCSSKPKKKYFSKNKEKSKPKEYCCDYSNCLYSTKLSSNLQKHIRTHTGEKPYLCDRCSFRTNFSNSLKVHRRLHTTERPYQCNYCNYKCNSISNLKKHIHSKHNDKYKNICT